MEKIYLAFSSPDCNKIFEYSGREMLDKEYVGIKYEQKKNIDNKEWDLVLEVDVSAYKEAYFKGEEDKSKREERRKELMEYAKKNAELLGCFRSKFYRSLIDKMLCEIKDSNGKKLPPTMTIQLNQKNKLTLIPLEKSLVLCYGIHFDQFTDQSLARNMLQELEETKRHVKNAVDVKYIDEAATIPEYIKAVDLPTNYSNGLLVFTLFVAKYNVMSRYLHKFVFLREYIQFHIHSIKTFLHIRMTKKFKYLENKLSAAKIIPDDFFKKMKTVDFYVNMEKKETQKSIFEAGVAKVKAK